MSARQMRKILKGLIHQEQDQLKIIEVRLKTEEPSLKSPVYLRLLAKASYHTLRVQTLNEKLSAYRKRTLVKNAFVNMNSQVQLVSTKIGATIWVDARNYVDLMGKSIGDIIQMHNSTFMIAGIY
jgi:hypothetical protein